MAYYLWHIHDTANPKYCHMQGKADGGILRSVTEKKIGQEQWNNKKENTDSSCYCSI